MKKRVFAAIFLALCVCIIMIGITYNMCFQEKVVIISGGDPPIGMIWKDEYEKVEATNYISVQNKTSKEKEVGFYIMGGEEYEYGEIENDYYQIVEIQKYYDGLESHIMDDKNGIITLAAHQEVDLMIKSENVYIGETYRGEKIGLRREGPEIEAFSIKQIPEKSEQIVKTVFMSVLIMILMLLEKAGRKQIEKWLVFPKAGIYRAVMTALGLCLTAVIVMCFITGKYMIEAGICVTALAVWLFMTSILFQHMGIKQKEDMLIIIPIIGKKRKIAVGEIGNITFEWEKDIQIAENGKEILRINAKWFHGYSKWKEMLN